MARLCFYNKLTGRRCQNVARLLLKVIVPVAADIVGLLFSPVWLSMVAQCV